MHIGMLAHLLSFDEGYRQAGVSRYIEYLLSYLPAELGMEDRITVFAGARARDRERRSAMPSSIRWRWTQWPTGRVPVRILWEQLAAPVYCRSGQVDVVHGPVNVVPLAGRVPGIATIHDLAFLAYPEQYPSIQRRYLKTMTRLSARHARRVITVSEFTRQDVISRLDVPDDRVTAVPNGVDPSFFPRTATVELERFRREYRLPDQFLLFVGTLQPRKNLIGLLRAFATIPKPARVPLYVVGAPGWMYHDIYAEVSQLGIANEVHFPGYAASGTLPLWYSASTAFVYPSFYEGFGLPVLESMACGTPVVASNRTSLPEVVGDAGLLVDPDDTEEIAGALETILNDENQRRELAARALKRAARFTWNRTARETVAVYRQVVNEG